MVSSSSERSNSAPRSRSSGESGPENSTRISGFSQSRLSARGGSTVMRYFSRKPPRVTIPPNNSLILLAAPTLSGIDMMISPQLSFGHGELKVDYYFTSLSYVLSSKQVRASLGPNF